MVVEYQDSRWENSQYPSTNREVNENEPIQMYGELHFKNALGEGQPLYIRGGRMAFELVDRRLIANNEFRNTTNNFQGVRIHLKADTGKSLSPAIIDRALGNVTFSNDPVASAYPTLLSHAVAVGTGKSGSITGLFDLTALNALRAKAGLSAISASGGE